MRNLHRHCPAVSSLAAGPIRQQPWQRDPCRGNTILSAFITHTKRPFMLRLGIQMPSSGITNAAPSTRPPQPNPPRVPLSCSTQRCVQTRADLSEPTSVQWPGTCISNSCAAVNILFTLILSFLLSHRDATLTGPSAVLPSMCFNPPPTLFVIAVFT